MAARVVAISADFLQIGLFPLFGEGFVSPLNDILDVAVGVTLTLLVGWHYTFLPSFLLELAPMVDLVPTWTIAVLIATRHKPTASAADAPSVSTVDVEANVSSSPADGQDCQKLLSNPGGQEKPRSEG